MEKLPKLLIFLPIYNEEEQLEKSARTVFEFASNNLTDYDWKIHVGDNASKDSSPEIYKKLNKENPKRYTYRTLDRKGRGLNQYEAWLKEDFDISIYMDIDLSTDLKSIRPCVDAIRNGEADLSIGSRLLKDSKVVGRKLLREITSRGYVFIVKTLASTKISDYQCGFKAISKELALKVLPFVEDRGWYFDTELILLTEKSGHKIHEEPVFWTDDPGSSVNVVKTAMDDLKGLYRTLKNKKWLEITTDPLIQKKYATTFFDFIFQFSRFFIIGGLSLLLNWGIVILFQLIVHKNELFTVTLNGNSFIVRDYFLGAIIGYIISAIANYFVNRKFTFNNKSKKVAKQMSVFFFVSLIGLILNTIITTILVEKFFVSSYIVTPLAAAIVLIWNFTGHRLLTFKKFT